MLGTRAYRAFHRHPRGQVAVIEEVVLGEPDEIESEPVEHDNLFHDRGVQARHVHARFRRVAEIVDGADAKGWTHDAWSPLVRMFAGSVQPRGLGHHLDGLGLTRSHAERIRAAVLPGAVAFAYAPVGRPAISDRPTRQARQRWLRPCGRRGTVPGCAWRCRRTRVGP